MSGLFGGESFVGITFAEKSLDLGEVGGVSDEVREFLAHILLSELVEAIELLPELLLNGHGGELRDSHVAQVKSIENTHGGLEALIVGQVSQFAALGKDEEAESGVVDAANELKELVSISLGNGARVDALSKAHLEDVLAVVLPHTLEVGLLAESGCLLVGHNHILLLDDLGGHLAKSLILSLESLLTFRGTGVQAEQNVLILVGVGEAVQNAVALSISISFEHVTLLAFPGELGHFVEEQTATIATKPVLESEPLKRIGLLTLTGVRLGGPLSFDVVHGVVPSLTRVSIDIPAVSVLVLGPVGDFESLEDGSRTTVEGNISYTLEEGVWMEVLSVNVMHHIRLLVELVAIDILNTESYIIIKIKVKHAHWGKHDSQSRAAWRALPVLRRCCPSWLKRNAISFDLRPYVRLGV